MKTNLGIDPITASIIVSLISKGIELGLSIYSAAQQAKQQAQLQRELEDAEISAIANSLAQQTNISFSQWFTVIRMTFSPSMPKEPPPEPKKDNTAMYVIFGIFGLIILTRR